MRNAMRELLDEFDRIIEEHDEVGDTDVREQMGEALDKLLFRPEPGYQLPQEFGMFSPDGEARVRGALQKFLTHPEVETLRGLPTPQARLDAFQADQATSLAGTTYDEYFGFREGFEE